MKKNLRHFVSISLSFYLLSWLLSSCTTSEWPRFRGNDNMVIGAKGLPVVWNDSTNIRWIRPMEGESWSSPIIFGDKIFYSTAVLVKKAPVKAPEDVTPPPAQPQAGAGGNTPPPPPRPQQEDNSYKEDIYRWQLTCLDLKTGNELWTSIDREGHPLVKKHAGSTYACETPVTDGKHVYVYFGMHGVYCFDMNGNLQWENDLGAYETLNGWGTGSSPVLYNQSLFIQVDNEENSFIVALDALTGEEKWKVLRDEKTTYATPLIWENNVRTELVTLGMKARSYDPVTGELIWELGINRGRPVASPTCDKDRIYLGNSGGPREVGGIFAVKAGATGDISLAEGQTSNEFIAWSDTAAGLGNPSPLLYNGLLYILADRGGEVNCFDAVTGERIYKEKAGKAAACWASPWVCNNQVYFYDEKGVTQIIEAGREFKVLGSNSIDDKFWASVAAVQDAYIFKGVKNIYCVRQ